MSALCAELPRRYTVSERIQGMPTRESAALLSRLASNLHDAAALMALDSGEVFESNMLDGLRLTFPDGAIVHLRPSGNAPELRCYAEAADEALAKALCLACLQRTA